MTPNYPNYNKNKKRYLELLKKRSEGDTSNYSELLALMEPINDDLEGHWR